MLQEPYTTLRPDIAPRGSESILHTSPGIWGQEMAQAVVMGKPIVSMCDIHDTILRQLRQLLRIPEEVWGPESRDLIVCWLAGLMDAVVGEHLWNDAVPVHVPFYRDGPAENLDLGAGLMAPWAHRVTTPVWSWMEAIQSLALDEYVEPWDWVTCKDCGYGDNTRRKCRVHNLDTRKKQRLNPQFGLPNPMQRINPFDARNAGYRYPETTTVRCPCGYELVPKVLAGYHCDACQADTSNDLPVYTCSRPTTVLEFVPNGDSKYLELLRTERRFGGDKGHTCDYTLCARCYNDPKMSTLCKMYGTTLLQGATELMPPRIAADGTPVDLHPGFVPGERHIEGNIPGRWEYPNAGEWGLHRDDSNAPAALVGGAGIGYHFGTLRQDLSQGSGDAA